jgi:hypothetical protein
VQQLLLPAHPFGDVPQHHLAAGLAGVGDGGGARLDVPGAAVGPVQQRLAGQHRAAGGHRVAAGQQRLGRLEQVVDEHAGQVGGGPVGQVGQRAVRVPDGPVAQVVDEGGDRGTVHQVTGVRRCGVGHRPHIDVDLAHGRSLACRNCRITVCRTRAVLRTTR